MQNSDKIFNLATDMIANTSRSVFLTGKAGTGKTTFLQNIKDTIDKNVIVAAPTAIAAINAGGVTLHSLFQLPFEAFTPTVEGRKKMDYHSRLNKSKIEMLKELELLIIDEVSMLRADMLDAIDYILKKCRNNQEVFGGVQILFVGDLFQLPPVVQNEEWERLSSFYASPYFFHAQALNNSMPLYIELKKIFRQQNDECFIDLLNKIRNNCTTVEDLNVLNQKYIPNFTPVRGEKYIRLCTHNYSADRINQKELKALGGDSFCFSGEVKGDFPQNSYPTDVNLVLKKGAQIMFIKNDSGESRKYYNGKLGTIASLSSSRITVEFEDGSIMKVEKETWRDIRYVLNKDSGEIEEKELGVFSQYPIRLAWAITIHKSQGLTFDKVIIDAGQAFAPGQVYVALSRCISLANIILYSKITKNSILTNEEALNFASQEVSIDKLVEILNTEKPTYTGQRLKRYFDWSPLIHCTRDFVDLANEKQVPNKAEVLEMGSAMYDKSVEQEQVANAFLKELDTILHHQRIDMLEERVQKASTYFHKEVVSSILNPLTEYLATIENASKVKAYRKKVKEIHQRIVNFLLRLENIYYGSVHLTEGLVYDGVKVGEKASSAKTKEVSKAQKGDSQRLTLSLFKEGKSIVDIANERNLKPITIESHLSEFVLTGEVEALDLVLASTIEELVSLLKDQTIHSNLKQIKESIPGMYSYFDIKVVLNYMEREKVKTNRI